MKKNRNLCSLVVTFCASAATTMALQSCQCQPSEPFTALSPAPQEIVWSEQVVNTPKSIVLVGAEEADADAGDVGEIEAEEAENEEIVENDEASSENEE